MIIEKEISGKDILIQDFEQSYNKIKSITKEYKAQVEEIRRAKDEKIDSITDQIYQLNSQKSDIEYKTSQQLRILEKDLYDRCSVLHKDIDKVQFILHALRLESNRTLSWEINNFHDKYVEELEQFYESPTIRLTTYIFENDWRNKVNKYSLFIVGKTIFLSRSFDPDDPQLSEITFPSPSVAVSIKEGSLYCLFCCPIVTASRTPITFG